MISTNCKFVDGKIEFTKDKEVQGLIDNNNGKEGYVTIKLGQEPRSSQQNRFFHGAVLDAFVAATGDTDKDYLKYYLKDKFLREYLDDTRYWVKDTHKLKVKEFTVFLQNCFQELIEVGGCLTSTEYDDYIYLTR